MKVIILSILLLIPITTFSQIYPTIEPFKARVGVMYHIPINVKWNSRYVYWYERVSIYGHVWYGELKDQEKSYGCKNFKIGIGGSYSLWPIKSDNATMKILFGFNRNVYFDINYNSELAYNSLFRKQYSFEFGPMINRYRLSIIAITDPRNWETMFGVYYYFNRKNRTNPCLKN